MSQPMEWTNEMIDAHIDELVTKAQRALESYLTLDQEAVDYISGPCLVLAGAGSGKTRVITTKIVSLIKQHMFDPASICAVTFTNKAAAEMKDRVKAQLGGEIASKLSTL